MLKGVAMNPSDLTDRLMAQARELQAKVSQAATQSAEQMRPYIEQSMTTAAQLQKTLQEHAARSAELNKEYADRALGHVSELLRIGSEAMRANAEQTRKMAQAMVDEAQRAYETTDAASRGGSKRKGGNTA
jgi:DNA anti-recombination protein RmuC